MAGRVRFVILLHSHQPVGNFDHVIEEAYKLSYLPFVEVFERFPQIPLTNHFSGCLLEWLEKKHPEYFDRLRKHLGPKAQGKEWEMIGGGMMEPVLTMLPSRDRQGQYREMSDYIHTHFGVRPRGAWITERVWEPALVKDLAQADVEYLTLDDNHFRAAGLRDDELVGCYVSEDEGQTVRIYPASERLRYLIPYAQVHEIMAHLRELVPAEGERVAVYADDGEKFGVWPQTFKHVYQDRWLENWLKALQQAQDEGWLVCSTLSDAYDAVAPVGLTYLPENSYREMTEWALPAQTLAAFERARDSVKDDPRAKEILPLVKGGNWRSFRVKYPEGGRMYGKMMEVSAKIAELPAKTKNLAEARRHLYRGQCNCPYWHGVFGGMYLPHLRMAIYRELIRAEKLADETLGTAEECVERDFDFDGEAEYKLSNSEIALYLHPSRGGHLYELDLRYADFNTLDTFSRRYEAYHDKVAHAVVGNEGGAQSIHEMVKAKQKGLEKLLNYDQYLRESLVDHLSPEALTPQDFSSGKPRSDWGFRQGAYEAEFLEEDSPAKAKGKAKAKKSGVGLNLTHEGHIGANQIALTKKVVLEAGPRFSVKYELKNGGHSQHQGFFAVEMNYNLLAGDAHDRYYSVGSQDNVGRLKLEKDFGTQSVVKLTDHWLDVSLALKTSVPAQLLVSPVHTVSQSEAGFEAVYQSSCVVYQWPIKLAPGETFSVELTQECNKAR